MSKKYVIQWKSKVNGRAGRGTKLFDWEEAQELAAELTAGYPDIHHESVPADAPGLPAAARPATVGEPAESEEEEEPVSGETQVLFRE